MQSIQNRVQGWLAQRYRFVQFPRDSIITPEREQPSVLRALVLIAFGTVALAVGSFFLWLLLTIVVAVIRP